MIARRDHRCPTLSTLVCALGLAAGCVDPEVPDDDRFDLGDESDSEGALDEDPDEGAGEGEGGELPPREPESVPPAGSGDDGEGGSGDDGEGGSPGDGDPNEGGACLEFSDVLAPVPPSVLFLLDRSGSMMATGFNPNDPLESRWQALYEGVEAVVGDDALAGAIEFGAKTFSTKGMGECGVSSSIDVPFELDNAQLLLSTIPGPTEQVNGGTPTQAAVAASLDYMRGYEAEGSKAMVLVTDGSIGCTQDPAAALEAITGELAGAREVDGIATYVVGIAPEFNSTKGQLMAMAVAGGSASYFEADDAAALTDALAEVVAASYEDSCLLELELAPSAPELTVVEAGGVAWPELQGCDEGDGWMWTNPELTRMRLCNAACDALLDTQEVHVEYHCNPG